VHFLGSTLALLMCFVNLFVKVHKAVPGSSFNSLLLNRYRGGNDYVGWHSDDEKLYGLTPEIASVSFGCEREFILKKKPSKTSHGMFMHSSECLIYLLLVAVHEFT
jgi:alkylated DNA repair dioxygenase AlkB